MIIGKIGSSSSHIEYICQVYGPGEAAESPHPEDYGFGTWVGISRRDGGYLVGVISNTTLLNPDFGNLGPRLSPESELTIFSPDYLAEKRTLVSIIILGVIDERQRVSQGVPLVAAEIDASVRQLTEDEIAAFHRTSRGVRATYLPVLLSMAQNPLIPPLTLQLLDQLEELFPAEAPRLALLRDHVAWRSQVQPLG